MRKMLAVSIVVGGIFAPLVAAAQQKMPSPDAAFTAEVRQRLLQSKKTNVDSTQPPQPPQLPPTPKIGEDVGQEYFRYIERKMSYECGKELYRLIKYEIRAPGIFWGKNSGQNAAFLLSYTRFSSRVAEDGTIRLLGDEAEAKNGLGNWMPIKYSCTVDVASQSVRNATIEAGKL
jgi:hypothetical protein